MYTVCICRKAGYVEEAICAVAVWWEPIGGVVCVHSSEMRGPYTVVGLLVTLRQLRAIMKALSRSNVYLAPAHKDLLCAPPVSGFDLHVFVHTDSIIIHCLTCLFVRAARGRTC